MTTPEGHGVEIQNAPDFIERKIDDLSIDELATAARLIKDLANAGVCEPDELRQLWRIAGLHGPAGAQAFRHARRRQ